MEWRNDPNRATPLDTAEVFRDVGKRRTADDPQDFDPKEVWRRITAIDTKPLVDGFPLARRDVAFMAVLFGTGMRPGEAATLRESSINYRTKTVSAPAFKQSAGADIAALAQVLPLVRKWQDDKRRKAHTRYRPTPYLFHGPAGGQVSRNNWKELLTRYGLRDGWKSGHGKPFTLRNLRATFASWMLNSPGGDLGIVQRQLRHKSPETTARFYARYQVATLHKVARGMKV